MECMEARALKSSFSSELAMKSTNTKNFLDDIWCVTGLPPSENFSIDEFFDLPNDENFDESSLLEEEEKETSCSQDPVDDSNSNSIHFSPGLAIPVDDVQELELWSHFMDDSIHDPTLARPNPVLDAQKNRTGFNFLNRVEPGYNKPVNARASFIPSVVPVKPRTKRSRLTGNRSWGLVLSSKTKSLSSSSPVSVLLYPAMARDLRGSQFPYRKPAMKKAKKKPDENGSDQRRCSHCQVTKTPQWRAGPDGPKTLCNACGVRFKSGRLFPEYRPACSPTFSSEVHSNSHRKVLEMRKKKKPQDSVSGSTSMPLAT